MILAKLEELTLTLVCWEAVERMLTSSPGLIPIFGACGVILYCNTVLSFISYSYNVIVYLLPPFSFAMLASLAANVSNMAGRCVVKAQRWLSMKEGVGEKREQIYLTTFKINIFLHPQARAMG